MTLELGSEETIVRVVIGNCRSWLQLLNGLRWRLSYTLLITANTRLYVFVTVVAVAAVTVRQVNSGRGGAPDTAHTPEGRGGNAAVHLCPPWLVIWFVSAYLTLETFIFLLPQHGREEVMNTSVSASKG